MAFDVDGAKKAGYSDEEIARFLSSQNKFDYEGAVSSGYSPIDVVDFLSKKEEPERTVLGQVRETVFKAIPRGFANSLLTAGEGLGELADAGTNVVGLEGLVDSGKENALVSASRAGRDWINNSALGVDPNYQDAWFTKFGEGLGSMASFLTPAAALRGLGIAGKALPRLGMGATELGAAGTLAAGAGAGDQAQRIEAARARGIDVTQGQEDAAIAFGGLIGLTEIAPIAQIIKRVPKNITPVDKSRILDLLQKSIKGGAEEAVQEAGAGLLQDLTERGIYNENLSIGESFWDDLTIGGAVGAFADFTVNAMAGRRSFMTTQAQQEYELKAREREQQNIQKIRESLEAEANRRASRQADPDSFMAAAAQAQAGAVNIPPPTVEGAPVTAGQAYARAISNELGEFFPANTKFEVREEAPTVTPTGEQIPNYVVIDSTGKQYGKPLQNYEQAAGLSYGLNNEVIDGQIRGQIINVLETADQPYDKVTADTLTRYGYQILNPEANMVTSAALNEAAGTTVDKGYIENYSFQTILDGEKVKEDGKTVGYKVQGPNQKETVVPGLTLAQTINQKRKESGLPETQTFTIDEAREALGDKFERLTDINVQAIPDGMTYTASIVGGKPSIVSSANEVFTSRFASQEDSDAGGKNEDGTPKIKVGQKIELQSLEDAQNFAVRKNKEAAKGQGLSVKEINALMKGKKTLNLEIGNLLKSKNIGSEIDTPEVRAMFKSIIGKESLSDMNFGEQRLLYARLRTLPTFEATTKLPLFEAKPYTRENFLRVSKFAQDANALGQPVTDDKIAEAAGIPQEDERLQIKVDALKRDLEKQGIPVSAAGKPVLALPAPDGTTDTYSFLRDEISKKMKGFGLEDIATRIDETLLNFGNPAKYMEELGSETEGYYNPFLQEIALAVDRIDPQKTLTPEQRVNALSDVLNHEIVHPVREMDLWTAKEWDTLSNASARLKRRDANGNPTDQTYLQWAGQTYSDQSPLVQEEEAVADLSRQSKQFGDKAVSGKPKVLADRLFKFFDRLDNSFRGAGFQRYSDILNRLQSGEVGARQRGEVRTLRATEAEMAQQGVLPERFIQYKPILASPALRNQEREKQKVRVQQQAQQAASASGNNNRDFDPAMLENAAIRESRQYIERIPANIEVDGKERPTFDSENRVIYSGYEGQDLLGINTRPTQEGLVNFWNWFGDSKAVNKSGRPLVFYHGTAADITAFRPKQAGSVFITRNPRFAEDFAGDSESYMLENFTDFMDDQKIMDVVNEALETASFTPAIYDGLAQARDEALAQVSAGKPIPPNSLRIFKDTAAGGRSSSFLQVISKSLPSGQNLIPVYVKVDKPWDYDNYEDVKAVIKRARENGADITQSMVEEIMEGNWQTIEGSSIDNAPILDAIRQLGYDGMYVEEGGDKNLAVFNPNQVKSAIGNNGDFSPLTPSIRESRVRNPQIDTPEFKRFFKDSKIVDENGDPLVLYHGTKKEIDEFKAKYSDGLIFFSTNPQFASKWPVGYGGKGDLREPPEGTQEWVNDIKKVQDEVSAKFLKGDDITPEQYDEFRKEVKRLTGFESSFDFESKAGVNVIPVYISSNKPFNPEKDYKKIEPTLKKMGQENLIDGGYHKSGNWVVYENKTVIDALRDMGYDSIWLREDTQGPTETLAVFSPNQIKSAVGNKGTFDITRRGIRESRVRNPQLDTPEFKRFFKDSMVVDENGEPLVVYHGTGANIESFRASRDGGALGTGIYFTPDPVYAGMYAEEKGKRYSEEIKERGKGEGGNVVPVYLSINNPLILDGGSFLNEPIEDPMVEALIYLGVPEKKAYSIVDKAYEKKGYITTEVRNRAIELLDYDGIFYYKNGKLQEIVAFRPEQIKSAIGNRGTFDIESPKIRESRNSPNVVSLMNNQEQPPRKLKGKTQVAQFLQDRAISKLGRIRSLANESDRDAIANDLLEEALYEMSAQKGALEWYDSTIERTIEMYALKHPEIKYNRGARTAFLLSLAITSQNIAVPDNQKYGEEVYSHFKKFNRFPEKGFGSKSGSMKKNFQKANELITKLGSMDAFADFLETKFRTGDLNVILKQHLGKGAKVGGELVDTIVYGSAVFGPKIGNGFYTNLRGDFSPVTIDMWFMRTIGRLTGKLMAFDEAKLAKQMTNLTKAEGIEGASTEEVIARAYELKKKHESDFKKFRSEYDSGVREKSTAVKAAFTIVQSLQSTRDAPSSGNERSQMRDVVNRAIEKMKARTGQDISPAAFQALIWYPEQDLYKKLGVKLKHIRQDYAKSAKQSLIKSGFDERDLKRAEDRVRSRRQRRTGRVRPGTTEPIEGAVAGSGVEAGRTVQEAEAAGLIRESRTRPKEQLDGAVKKAEENIVKAPVGAIPLYSLNASPDALYVAQNPDLGEKLDANDLIRYSRQNEPNYSPGMRPILDKLTSDPPNQPSGQTVIQSMQLPRFRDTIDKLRQQFINNYSRLEFYNQSHPSLLQNSADVSSLVGAEMADRYRAITASAIKDGVPVYRNGITKVEKFIHNNREYKGLIDVMAPLYGNSYGSLERLAQSYAIAIRGIRLTAEGKLAPGDPLDLQRIEAEVARFVNPETGNPIVKEWYEAWQAYNGYVIQYLRDTGMIDDAGAQLWMSQSDYVPFYKETKAGTIAHPRIFGGLTATTNMKSVGKSSEAINMPLLESILTNLDAAIGMGSRNVAQQRIVRDMIRIGMGRMALPDENLDGLFAVTFKVQGKKYTAVIDDPLIFESMQALPDMGIAGIFESIFRVPATVLRELITRDPGYMAANILRDTASASLTTGANIIPVYDTVKNIANGLDELSKYGVVGGYDFNRDPASMAVFLSDEAKKRGHKIQVEHGALGKIARSPYMKPFKLAWDALGQVTDMAEASTRKAVYEDTLKRFGNSPAAEAEAVYQALSVINYGRRGRNPSMRALTAAVPFMNARIQGLDKLYQAGIGKVGATKDRGKNLAAFYAKAALMVGITALYYTFASDEEEYKNANPETIDNYYILPTGLGFAVKIPIPFEVGLLFKTLPERIMRSYKGTDTPRDSAMALARGVTSTLAFNPVPHAVLPIAEVIANYDTFTGREVVSPYMDERLAAQYQTRFGTNELARYLGEATGLSPIKIDHLMNGYSGTLGTYALNAVDSLMRGEGATYPSRDWYEYPVIRRFFADANQPGLQSQYYDLYKEVDKVTNTIRFLKKEGREDELNAYIMENQNIIAVKKDVNALDKIMDRYRKEKLALLKSPIDADSKKELIDRLDADINKTLQVIPVLKKAAFDEQRQTRQ